MRRGAFRRDRTHFSPKGTAASGQLPVGAAVTAHRRPGAQGKRAMHADTMVLRKDGHWFVVGAPPDRESRLSLVLSLLEHAEHRVFEVELREVDRLAADLGWTLDFRRGFLGAA